jgi:hypothetical protein
MGWVWNVAGVGEDKNTCIFLISRPEGKRPFGRGLNVRIEVNRIVEGEGMSWWTVLILLRSGKAARSCEQDNAVSGSTQREEFLDWLRNHQLLKNLLLP